MFSNDAVVANRLCAMEKMKTMLLAER